MAILPGTTERDAPQVNSSHDQRDAAITVEVAMGEPGDGPLYEVCARINDWNPPSSLCVIDSQVAAVEQIGATATGRGETRQVKGRPESILMVKYRTAAGRLTAT